MTVDSRYDIKRYLADDEVNYIFDTESLGSEAIEVYRVDTLGVRNLLVENTDYTLEFDVSEAPIYRRGKVVLTTPLSEGEQLSLERKTPITNTLTLTSGEPFPAEKFENMIDRICFIEQEIEGSFCDCRSTGGGTGPLPTCEVYECDQIENAIISIAPWLYNKMDQDIVDEPPVGTVFTSTLGPDMKVAQNPGDIHPRGYTWPDDPVLCTTQTLWMEPGGESGVGRIWWDESLEAGTQGPLAPDGLTVGYMLRQNSASFKTFAELETTVFSDFYCSSDQHDAVIDYPTTTGVRIANLLLPYNGQTIYLHYIYRRVGETDPNQGQVEIWVNGDKIYTRNDNTINSQDMGRIDRFNVDSSLSNSPIGHVIADNRAWDANDMATFKAAWEQNKTTYQDPRYPDGCVLPNDPNVLRNYLLNIPVDGMWIHDDALDSTTIFDHSGTANDLTVSGTVQFERPSFMDDNRTSMRSIAGGGIDLSPSNYMTQSGDVKQYSVGVIIGNDLSNWDGTICQFQWGNVFNALQIVEEGNVWKVNYDRDDWSGGDIGTCTITSGSMFVINCTWTKAGHYTVDFYKDGVYDSTLTRTSPTDLSGRANGNTCTRHNGPAGGDGAKCQYYWYKDRHLTTEEISGAYQAYQDNIQ